MAAVTICSDFETQENKVCHCFHCFPIYLPWNDGTRCHDLSLVKENLLQMHELRLWRLGVVSAVRAQINHPTSLINFFLSQHASSTSTACWDEDFHPHLCPPFLPFKSYSRLSRTWFCVSEMFIHCPTVFTLCSSGLFFTTLKGRQVLLGLPMRTAPSSTETQQCVQDLVAHKVSRLHSKPGPWPWPFHSTTCFSARNTVSTFQGHSLRQLVLRWCWEGHLCPSNSVAHTLSPLQTMLWSRGTSPSLLERHAQSTWGFVLRSTQILVNGSMCLVHWWGSLGSAHSQPMISRMMWARPWLWGSHMTQTQWTRYRNTDLSKNSRTQPDKW